MSSPESTAKVESLVDRRASRSTSPELLRRLVEALTPPPATDEQKVDRARLVAQAATFATGQIAALPVRLRILFTLGMLFFQVVTVAFHLRPFASLDPSRRRAWVERWAYGSWSLGRQLFRPVRSVVIVAFYADPSVARALGDGSERPTAAGENGPE